MGDITNNSNNSKHIDIESPIPLVYLDIHVSKDKVDRIALYKGQNAEEVIQRFAMKNYLTPQDV